MPGRPADLLENVPLFIVSSILRQKIGSAGEERERIVVKEDGRHFYNICIHLRTVKRELWAGAWRAGTRDVSI